MSSPRHALGLAAEAAVAAWLSDAGWRVVERRARSPDGGEVDIVAIDPRLVLVAIEVRARRTRRTGEPAVTVDGRRIGRLGRTLAAVSARHRVPHVGMRIDLVTAEPAVAGGWGQWRLRRLPGIG